MLFSLCNEAAYERLAMSWKILLSSYILIISIRAFPHLLKQPQLLFPKIQLSSRICTSVKCTFYDYIGNDNILSSNNKHDPIPKKTQALGRSAKNVSRSEHSVNLYLIKKEPCLKESS